MQVEGINYDINWKNFRRGSSFFIPCLDINASRNEILTVTKRLKIKVLAVGVVEHGIKGLRVWRM